MFEKKGVFPTEDNLKYHIVNRFEKLRVIFEVLLLNFFYTGHEMWNRKQIWSLTLD